MSARSRRWATISALIVPIVLLAVPAAFAHSELVRSDPSDGGTVAVGRSTFSLWFTESVNPETSGFDLRDDEGNVVDVIVSDTDGEFVELQTEALDESVYVLGWRVVALDGHPSNGAVTFGVGVRPPVTAGSADDGPALTDLALDWINLSALMLVIGALAVSGRVLTHAGDVAHVGRAPERRARRVAAGAGVIAVVMGGVIALERTPRGDGSLTDWVGSTWGTLSGTSWGLVWTGRELALLVMAAFLVLWARPVERRALYARGAIAALSVAVLLDSFTGHASTLPSRSLFAAAASATHLVGAGIWAGGLVILVICVVPLMRRNADLRGPLLSTVWRRFSPMAAVATVLVLASGLYLAGRNLPGLSDVTGTSYGTAVSAKVLLLVGALLLAGLNTMLVNPRFAVPVQRAMGMPAGWAPVSLRRFTTVVTVEAVVLVMAVGAAAWLASVPTAREIAEAQQVAAPQTTSADGLFVTFETVTAGEDQTRLIVRASSTDKIDEQPITDVGVALAGPTGGGSSETLTETEPGRFEAQTAQLGQGDWLATITITRVNLPLTTVPMVVTVAEPNDAHLSKLELVSTVAAAVLLLGLGGVLGDIRRRRRETGTESTTAVAEPAQRR